MSLREPAKLLPTHTSALFGEAVRRATELLRAGEVVALPTETVYGLAANAWDAAAVERLYEVKQRPARNPVIVHVASLDLARRCVRAFPAEAERLAAAFWPGPLTLVLFRAPVVPDIVTAGGDTVGIRWPSHPFIQAVIRQCGFPLAAPSANVSGQISPTNAVHVQESLGDRIPLIIDGGASHVGIESTVLDLTTRPARVLRPGMIHAESLAAALGPSGPGAGTVTSDLADAPGPGEESRSPPLRSPGQLERHYAPRAKLLVLSWRDGADLAQQLSHRQCAPARCAVLAHSQIPSSGPWAVSVIPHDAEAYARAFYAELHRCDAAGVEWIVVEALPELPAWQGIANRLRRASA